MATINYHWIGWCKEGTHDKVWGVIRLGEDERLYPYRADYLVFWGRRGARLQTKVSRESSAGIHRLVSSKIRKGYDRVNRDGLNDVYPEFQSDLEKTTTWSLLCRR